MADHGDHGGDSGMDMGHGMQMSFYVGTVDVILFDFWKAEKVGWFILSICIIFFMALAYEALKMYRETLYKNAVEQARNAATSANAGLLGNPRHRMLNGLHAYQTFLHMVQFVLSYFLMLIFMTYNVWLAIAVTLGAGVGYFLFGWNKNMAVDLTDHCQ